MFGRRITKAAALIAVSGLAMATLVVAQMDTTVVSFTKSNPDGDGIWEGSVSGAVEGDLTTTLLDADQSQPVWLVAFEAVVSAGDNSLRAHVGGTLDTTTGEVRMSGVVTEGHMLGATIAWTGQMVDEDTSTFEGEIGFSPPSR